MKVLLSIVVAMLVLVGVVFLDGEGQNLTHDSNFDVQFQAISSILRTEMTAIHTVNESVIVGDVAGSVSTWTYDSKKKTLTYQDISREATPILPQNNPVVEVDSSNTAIVALTSDGHFTSYAINSALKITGSTKWQLNDQFISFSLIPDGEQFYIAGILSSKTQFCIYKLNESLVRPNPLTKITCNETQQKSYQHIAYQNQRQLLAVGDKAGAYIFSFNTTLQSLQYLATAFLPKVDNQRFHCTFSRSGVLLATNDLWVNSIIIDTSVPSAKVISSERTEKFVKEGFTSFVAVNHDADAKDKNNTVIANVKGKLLGYSLGSNSKLAYKNDSKTLGSPTNFALWDSSILFASEGQEIKVAKIGSDSTSDDYINVANEYPIPSSNHFQPVNRVALYNNTLLVSVSKGGKNNLKIWKLSDYKLTLLDQKSITFFTILQAGYVDFRTIAFLPPPSKQNINATVHVALSGANPFQILIAQLTSDNKIKYISHSKDTHSQTVTAIFLTKDEKNIVSMSMDTTIKTWQLTNERQEVNNTDTAVTKNGPISHALQASTEQFYVLAHCNTNTSKLANITIWKINEKKKFELVTENVPHEANQANLSALIFSHDEKYLISLAQTNQMRLWRHENFTMVDLLASLSLGSVQVVQITPTETNHVMVETDKEFIDYAFDFNGFILNGRISKKFNTSPSASLISGSRYLSGDNDGSIRAYSLVDP